MRAHELASIVGGKILGDGSIEVNEPVPIEMADSKSTIFLLDEKFDKPLNVRVVVSKKKPRNIEADAIILVENPREAFIKTLSLFYKKFTEPVADGFKVIGKNCEISSSTRLFPFVYIGNNVKIGDGTFIYPFVFIEENVEIGRHTIIHSNVVIGRNVKIGDYVIIHSGAVIGADGFGFEKKEEGYLKIPQIGGVVIEDDVEIGANCTIDRATIGNTVIKKGVKLDDQVHIAHNVTVGEHTVMAAQTGIAGSTRIGKWVMMGGQVGVKDHTEVADYTIVMAQSGITKPTESGKMYVGSPAREARKAWRELAFLSKLEELFKRVAILEKRLEEKDDKE